MSDETSGESTENPPVEETTEQPKTIDVATYEKLERANNWAQGKVREQAQQLEELQAKVADLSKAKGPKKESNEVPQTALDEINRLKAEHQKALEELNVVTVKSEVMAQAQKAGILPDALEDFWHLSRSDFSRAKSEETGESRVVVKSEPWKNFEEYFDTLKSNKPWLFGSPRKKGADVPTNGNVQTKDLSRLNQMERIKALRENPELLKAEFSKMKLPHS
jgi:hypothetical protein